MSNNTLCVSAARSLNQDTCLLRDCLAGSPCSLEQALPTDFGEQSGRYWKSLQEAGLYDEKKIVNCSEGRKHERLHKHVLSWFCAISERMQQLLSASGEPLACHVTDNLTLANQASVLVFVEHAPRSEVCNDSSQRCNLEVVRLVRRFAGITSPAVDSIQTELLSPQYATGRCILFTMTIGVETAIRFIGPWPTSSSSDVMEATQDSGILHCCSHWETERERRQEGQL